MNENNPTTKIAQVLLFTLIFRHMIISYKSMLVMRLILRIEKLEKMRLKFLEVIRNTCILLITCMAFKHFIKIHQRINIFHVKSISATGMYATARSHPISLSKIVTSYILLMSPFIRLNATGSVQSPCVRKIPVK